MAKKNFYAVKKGLCPGIYKTWEECKAQVVGFSGAIYKGFSSLEEAEDYLGIDHQIRLSFDPDPVEVVSSDSEEEPPREVEKASSDFDFSVLLPKTAVSYVDGSYNAVTGDYGAGLVVFYEGKEYRLTKKGEDSDLASMRNVAGEILAAELAMRKAIELGADHLILYHDYQGIASWCLGQWKTNKEGTRAYRDFYQSIQSELKVDFRKVKGHSGDTWNDLADRLAKESVGNE